MSTGRRRADHSASRERHSARLAAIPCQRLLVSFGASRLIRIVFPVLLQRHQATQPLPGTVPVFADVDIRVWLEADCMARPIVEMINGSGLTKAICVQYTAAVAQRDLAQLRGDSVVVVMIVLPQLKRDVRLNVVYGRGNLHLCFRIHNVLMRGEVQELHFDAVFAANQN